MGDCCLWTNERPAHNDGESKTLPSLTKIPRSQPGSDSVLRHGSSLHQHVTDLGVSVPVLFTVVTCGREKEEAMNRFCTVFEQVVSNQMSDNIWCF